MTAESIERTINDWEVAQGVIVPPEIRRKITEGYQPTSQRQCLSILTTIRAVRPQQFLEKKPVAASDADTVSDLD